MSPTVTDALTTSLAGEPAVVVPSQAISVREKPPLRLAIDIETPSGRHYRWGQDEPNPANVFSGLRFSSTMPGGYESMDCVLPRKPNVDYSDLERLSTATVYGPGVEVCGEFRLERTPRTSGNEMSVSPGCVGWQAHLEDDKSVTAIFRDINLGGFGELPLGQRVVLLAAGWALEQSSVTPDVATGLPGIEQLIPSGDREVRPTCYITYDAGPGNLIASVYYELQTTTNVAATFEAYVQGHDDDSFASGETGSDIITAPNATFTGPRTFATSRRIVTLTYQYDGTTGFTAEFPVYWRKLALYGNHGLTLRGTEPAAGFFDSDIVGYALRWAPLLNFSDDTVRPTGFVIPHAAYREPTTVGEIVRQTARYQLPDWAVWDDKTFWFHPRGAEGKRWRARMAPAQLEETGPQVDRLWQSILVSYADVDGSNRVVGPPGSGADVEDAALEDTDPENPANQLGIKRRDLLALGTSTSAGAIEAGRIFLEQAKLLDRSGRAQFVGYVEDDHGVTHPAWKVRAGDSVTFVDASDSSDRRIVRAEYSHDTRTCSVDLDSPPEALASLLERLGAVLVPLGLN